MPTLLIYAGDDRLVQTRRQPRLRGRRAGLGAQRHLLSTALYHEIFNERDAEPVFETLERWLDERFPAA